MVDVTEKMSVNFRLVVKGKGGHSSTPWTDRDPVRSLGKALVKVGEHRFPARAIPSVREALASLGMLVVGLVAVVGLAKVESPAIEGAVAAIDAPPSAVGRSVKSMPYASRQTRT